MRKKYFVLSCLFCIIIVSCNKSQSLTEIYNLNFDESHTISPWTTECSLSKDSTLFYEGKQSFRLTFTKPFSKQSLLFGKKIKPITVLWKQFQLPQDTKYIEFSIYDISPSCKISIRLSGYNNFNERLIEDTISQSKPNTDWNKLTIKKHIPKKVSHISIAILAEQTEKAVLLNDEKLSVWFDKAELLSEGKNFNKLNVNHGETLSKSELNQKISLDDNNFSKIDLFCNKRIVGLGETVHGSLNVNNFVFDALRYMVERQHIKLITFELPYDMVMCWNSYIDVNSTDSLDYLIPTGSLLDINALGSFLKWLKEYNHKHCINSVVLVGLDGTSNFGPDDYTLRFLSNLPHRKCVDELMKIYYENYIFKPYIIYKFALKYKYFIQNEIGVFNTTLLLRTLSLKSGMILKPKANLRPDELRDYFMFENAKYAIDSLIKPNYKVVMYSHLAHLAKLGFIVNMESNNSMGKYLTEKYSNEYAVIGICVGQGKILCENAERKSLEAIDLTNPILNSLETVCVKQKENISYLKLNNINDKFILMRYCGAFDNLNQFYNTPFRLQMDAVLFMKDSKPINMPNNHIQNADNIMKESKVKQRRISMYFQRIQSSEKKN
jgi:erythromycin esterase-like protein